MSRLYKIELKKGVDVQNIIRQLSSLPEVLYAEPDGISVPCIAPNDTHYSLRQWSMNNSVNIGRDIHAEAAWDIYKGSSSSIIAILDGGVDRNHVDLNDKITGGDIGIGSGNWESHGTHVAGIAAAESNNGQGITGVDWNARVHPQRVDLGGDAETYQAIVDAVNYSSNVYVLNNSYALSYEDRRIGRYSTTVRQAVAYAYKNNRVFVAAMGNHQGTQPDVIAYPAGYPNVIAVGSTNNNDVIASSSGNGSHIDVCAPGVGIYSIMPEDGYDYLSGTSMATPHVAGLASLLKGYNTNLANDDIENIIQLSADKVSEMAGNNFTNEYGYGRINAGRALSFLKNPYQLVQATATGGTAVSTSGSYVHQFMGASGLATGNYLVKRIEVQKTIPLPSTIYNISGLWGRGVHTTGWRASSPNFGEGYCEIVPGSLTDTNVTLRTYVYQIWDILGRYFGYYPKSPSNVTFAYSVLGLETPSISGPSTVCDQATYTISNLPEGAMVQWSASNNCLTLIAGQGTPSALFKGNGNDYCNVNATITIGGQSLPLQPLRIWCGTPVINNISGTQHFPMGGTGVYMAEVWGSDDTTLEWSVYPSLPVWFSGNHAYVTFPSTNGDYRITLTATNSCGSVESYHFASTGEYEPFRINPNPARNFVTVELQDDRTTNAYSASTAYEIQLWSATSLLRKFATDQDTYQFSVADLPRGIYFVRVVKDGKTHTQKLIKN